MRVVEVRAQAAAEQGLAAAARVWVVAVTALAAADSVLEEVERETQAVGMEEVVAETALAEVAMATTMVGTAQVGMAQVAAEREEVAMAAAAVGTEEVEEATAVEAAGMAKAEVERAAAEAGRMKAGSVKCPTADLAEDVSTNATDAEAVTSDEASDRLRVNTLDAVTALPSPPTSPPPAVACQW